MIKLVLLDLDDTLLGRSMESLWSAYFPLIDEWMTARLAMPDFMKRLLKATDHMIEAPNDATQTNRERFLQAFLADLDIDAAHVWAAFDEFYATQYPSLRQTVTRLPAARALVTWLFAQGYPVVIATNPLFPRAAVEQRLAWAGVPAGEFAYTLVTTIENMHFTKPHPAYYAEILARTGYAGHEAIMVGDSLDIDKPAVETGMSFYWVQTSSNAGQTPPAPTDDGVVGTGTLDDFVRLVCEENWLDTLG